MKDLDQLDYSALELLATSRRAVEKEISDRAQALHEKALEDDRTLTLIGQVGHDAVGLYHDFARRDAYFRGPGHERRYALFSGFSGDANYSRPFKRRVRKYAEYIRGMHDEFSEEWSERVAIGEISRLDQEKEHNELAKRFGYNQTSRIHTDYTYVSPALFDIDPEIVDAYQIGQQWRVSSNVPFAEGLQIRILHRFIHERGIKRDATAYTLTSVKEDGSDTVVSDGQHEVIESDLYLPIGLIQAARQAVRESVPHRISKRW